MNSLTIKVPDLIYQEIVQKAARSKQPLDKLVLKLIESGLEKDDPGREDPLLQLAGIIESDYTDIAEKHDDYIGKNLTEDHE